MGGREGKGEHDAATGVGKRMLGKVPLSSEEALRTSQGESRAMARVASPSTTTLGRTKQQTCASTVSHAQGQFCWFVDCGVEA
eukprot:6191981-Pleurochrysis_carterae.AAC.12